jgi:hypothetical protein
MQAKNIVFFAVFWLVSEVPTLSEECVIVN